jgi:hypothetical protein
MIEFVVLLIVLMLIGAFWMTVKNMRQVRDLASGEDLTPEARTMYRKVERLYTELQETAERNKDSASPFVAQEALMEGEKLLRQVSDALKVRDKLKREARGQYLAEKGISDLESRMATATSDEERTTLNTAIAARQTELGQYQTIQSAIDKIDSSLHQAEALLGEMRARVAASATGGTGEEGVESLREAIGRMKALNASVEEIEEITRDSA